LTTIFETLEQNTKEGQFLGGDRSRGIEELMDYLAKREEQFQRSKDQRAAEILVHRARQDFEVAAVCIASGMYTVVFDMLRDVMEIECLLRDFCYYKGHAETWLNSDKKVRRREFQPAVLRKRYAEAIGKKIEDLPDHIDYRGHSISLHVSPSSFLVPRGLAERADPIAREFCFQDLFGHARNLIVQIENNLPKESRDQTEPEPFSENFLPRLLRAFQSTQLLGSAFLELLKQVKNGDDDDTAESETMAQE